MLHVVRGQMSIIMTMREVNFQKLYAVLNKFYYIKLALVLTLNKHEPKFSKH